MLVAIIVVVVGVVAFASYLVWENNTFSTTTYDYVNEKYPRGLEGLTIVQISDLHNKRFGNDNSRLADKIEKENPHLIFITGDLIDSAKTDNALDLVARCAAMAPVFFVSGNHEGDAGEGVYPKLLEDMRALGVTVLDNEVSKATYNGINIGIAGISDPNFYVTDGRAEYIKNTVRELSSRLNDTDFNVALSHRPEYLNSYTNNNIDVTFTGHAHGGQWRIFGQGIYTKNQGLFPKYTSGMHRNCDNYMVISRGLGNSVKLIPRIFNRPEIVVLRVSPAQLGE